MSPQYYGMVKGVEYLNSNLDDGSLNAVGYGASALVAGGNLIRMGLAYKNKKAYAAFSNDGLLFNSTTYIKKFGDFIISALPPSMNATLFFDSEFLIS